MSDLKRDFSLSLEMTAELEIIKNKNILNLI